MKKYYLLLIYLMLSICPIFAQLSMTIDVSTLGTLETLLGANKNTVTDLKVTGRIYKTEFSVFKEAQFLKDLDLSALAEMSPRKNGPGGIIGRPKSIGIGGGLDEISPGEGTGDFSINYNLPEEAFGSKHLKKVRLPTYLEYITKKAFYNSQIEEIVIDRNIIKIHDQAFANSTKLIKITCKTIIPPILGSNVFLGVNTANCVLEVPKASLELYKIADGWKNFKTIKALEFETIPLVFKLKLNVKGYVINDTIYDTKDYSDNNAALGRNAKDRPDFVPHVPEEELRMDTKGTRIGEYYWTDVFDLHIPHFLFYSSAIGSLARYPITQDFFDLYLLQCYIDYERFTPNLKDFTKYYGEYYDSRTLAYILNYGVMYEGNRVDPSIPIQYNEYGKIIELREKAGPGWIIPLRRDYRQLFAMAPFIDKNNTKLGELDIRAALSPRVGENPLAYDINNGTAFKTYWFDGFNTNMYGFNLMPSGSRLFNVTSSWTNGIPYNPTFLAGTPFEKLITRNDKGEWVGPKGGFSHLFYSASFPSVEGPIILDDFVTDNKQGYNGMPLRWCRRLTNEELGYKLFIKVNNINKNSVEWIELADKNNDIPLLNEVKSGKYALSDFDIVKKSSTDKTPNGYIELPAGYIRGFYYQYMIENPNSGKSIENIILYASQVRDTALGVGFGNKAITKKSNTKSIEKVENALNKNLSIYPNPVEDVLNINSSETVNSLSIYSISGTLVKTIKNPDSSINVSGLTPGSYILKLETNNKIHTERIIKK